MPAAFIELIEGSGLPDTAGLLEALASGDPVVAVRLNRRKTDSEPAGGEPVAWCADGYRLGSRQQFTFDPAFHQGLYYVQDPSSMVIAHIVSRLAGDMASPVCLDACAAPGGKTTAMIGALPDDAFVVANEYVPSRAVALRDNVMKWDSRNAAVAQGPVKPIGKLRDTFDIILTDVPCSGEGMMRKDDEAVAQWTPALVGQCASLQRDIVADLWPALKPGGYLIYSTCTFNRVENDDNVRWIIEELGAEPVDVDMPGEWGVWSDGLCHRFMPHRLPGEGLTVAVLRKSGSSTGSREKPARVGKVSPAVRDASRWIEPASGLTLVERDGVICALPAERIALVDRLGKVLNLLSAGVEVAGLRGRDLVPSHALAMSSILKTDAFPRAEVGYACAMAYLRREAIVLPEGTPRGYVLPVYGGRPLGFAKNLGARANNLYPQSMRILSTHIPDLPPVILEP